MFSIAVRGATGEISNTDIKIALVLLPAALAGLWLSRFFTDRIEGAALKKAVLLVSALAAAGLLVSTVA